MRENYNLLIDYLPTRVNVGGVEMDIQSDFRTALLFEMLMDDGSVPAEDKGIQAIRLFFHSMPSTEDEAQEYIDRIMWFYRCGKEPNEYMRARQEKREKQNDADDRSRIYDFRYDDDYIYAAFIQQYGINLNSIEYMHWWEFRALFKGLTGNTEFVKIMEFRGMKITDSMSKEQKSYYRKMKRIYALPIPKEERERMDAITEALMNGGDLKSLSTAKK